MQFKIKMYIRLFYFRIHSPALNKKIYLQQLLQPSFFTWLIINMCFSLFWKRVIYENLKKKKKSRIFIVFTPWRSVCVCSTDSGIKYTLSVKRVGFGLLVLALSIQSICGECSFFTIASWGTEATAITVYTVCHVEEWAKKTTYFVFLLNIIQICTALYIIYYHSP